MTRSSRRNAGEISVEEFGAELDYTTDDSAAFAAAVAEVSSRPYGGTVSLPNDARMRLTADITIPDGVSIWCHGNSEIRYFGTGTALTLVGQRGISHRIHVRVEDAIAGGPAWWNNSDSSTTGVRLQDTRNAQFEHLEVIGAWTGVHYESGSHFNQVYQADVTQSMRGIVFDEVANSNQILGGNVTISPVYHDGALNPIPGTVGIDSSGNNNTFINVNLENENDGQSQERSVVIRNAYNYLLFCRFEDAAPIEFTAPNGNINTVMLGYHLRGFSETPEPNSPSEVAIIDNGEENIIMSHRGMNMFATDGVTRGGHTAAYVARPATLGLTGEGHAFQTFDQAGAETFRVDTDGVMRVADAGGNLRQLRINDTTFDVEVWTEDGSTKLSP